MSLLFMEFVFYRCEDCNHHFAVQDSEEWSELECPVCGSLATEYVDHVYVVPVKWEKPHRKKGDSVA